MVQLVDFFGGSYASGCEISMAPTVKCVSARRDTKRMHRKSWSLVFEEKGEEHPGRHYDIGAGAQPVIDNDENWCMDNFPATPYFIQLFRRGILDIV